MGSHQHRASFILGDLLRRCENRRGSVAHHARPIVVGIDRYAELCRILFSSCARKNNRAWQQLLACDIEGDDEQQRHEEPATAEAVTAVPEPHA